MNINDKKAVAAIRNLCIDMINTADSGHPGIALGAAPIVYTLYNYHLISDPKNPNWINRDRFILSCGHASSLLYAVLHLCGYKITLEDLKKFRTINSITPGHPEYGITPGVDATSGPLGQGIAQAVGCALSEKILSNQFKELINHYTFCMVGDGCLEEGISQEAISFAGLHKLNKLIVLYDSNDVTLDGYLSDSSAENTEKRFIANNWNVLKVNDGNNVDEINKAILNAKKTLDKPNLIIIKTIIGFGSINEGTSKVHGSPLGEIDGNNAKKKYGVDFKKFIIPKDIYNIFNIFVERGNKAYKHWQEKIYKFKKTNPKLFKLFIDAFRLNNKKYILEEKNLYFLNKKTNIEEATRNTSYNIINLLADKMPFLIGGSADVSKSVLTNIKNSPLLSCKNKSGKNIQFGVREFAMAGIQNGMLLHGGLRPFVGCFLVFADYMKAAIRMSALSKLPAIYLFSHDSIFVGEDGATHQPIEQLAMLRSIPNIQVFRPCDAKETYGAWKMSILSKKTPSCIILTRQKLPSLENSDYKKLSNGAYIIDSEKKKKFITIIASGSEVKMAIEIKKILKNITDVRVVSMPSMELFDKLSLKQQEKIIGKDYNKRFAIEALSPFGWHKYAKNVFSINEFGRSGISEDIAKYFGFTSKEIATTIIKKLKKNNV
ncbi:MAG: transketolase [Bacilli bacterium]|nr:transketolase [Bacilli bacterium]